MELGGPSIKLERWLDNHERLVGYLAVIVLGLLHPIRMCRFLVRYWNFCINDGIKMAAKSRRAYAPKYGYYQSGEFKRLRKEYSEKASNCWSAEFDKEFGWLLED